MSEPAGRLGPYRIEGKLGEGGMGSVFAARHDSGERVALKVLRRDAFLDEVSLLRFGREARALADLRHPNVVALRDVGVLPGVGHYLALELVEGGSLADRIKRGGPLPEAEAIHVLLGLCAAIGAAHDLGVLHRDLKPANVLLRDGDPVLTDFGLARPQVASQQLTQTGDVLGTPAYMAPEQTGALELGVSPATDIYGLGATLYAALTACPPFRGASLVDVLLRVGAEVPESPSLVRGEPLSPQLEAICLRCLAKQPSERYASASELSEALQALRSAPAPGPAAPVRTLVGMGALVLGLGLSAAALHFKPPPSSASASRTPAPPSEAAPAESPEGETARSEPIPEVAGLRWYPGALGPATPAIRAALEKLRALDLQAPRGELVLGTEGPALADCASVIASLPATSPAERLGRVHLWAEVLEWLDPPHTFAPRPPSEPWRLALVQALRWAHAEVASNPHKASALALRGRLWRLHGLRLAEDWRPPAPENRAWTRSMHEAFADLSAALDRAPSSWGRAFLEANYTFFVDCARALEAPRDRRLREAAKRVADDYLAAFPDRFASHSFRLDFAPESERSARRAQAEAAISDPAQRAWLGLRGEPSDAALVDERALDPKLRLSTLMARVDEGQADPSSSLALAARLVRDAPQPRTLRGWRVHLTLKALRRWATDATPQALARARQAYADLKDSLASYRPRISGRLLVLATHVHAQAERQPLRRALLREAENSEARLAYAAHLDSDEEALPELRRLSLATQLSEPAIYPKVLSYAKRRGLGAELDALRQLSEHLRRVDAAQSPEQCLRVVAALRGSDLGVRVIVTARSTLRWLRSWPLTPLWQQLVDGTLAEFERWITQAQGSEQVFAHTQRMTFLTAVCAGSRLQGGARRQGALQALAQSASVCAAKGPRSQLPRSVLQLARALTEVALRTPRGHSALEERYRRARAAVEEELRVVGYEPTAMGCLLTLARYARDWPAIPRLDQRAARACVPLWPLEASLALERATCAALTFDLARAEALLDAVVALPGRDPRRYTNLPLHQQLTLLRARVHARRGRAAEALDSLNALAREVRPRGAELASLLRSRAFVARRLGETKQALEDLRRARELSPAQRVMIDLELSDAYARGGDDEQAASHWKRAAEAISLAEHFVVLSSLVEAGERRLAAKLADRLERQTLTPPQAAAAAKLRTDLQRLTE